MTTSWVEVFSVEGKLEFTLFQIRVFSKISMAYDPFVWVWMWWRKEISKYIYDMLVCIFSSIPKPVTSSKVVHSFAYQPRSSQSTWSSSSSYLQWFEKDSPVSHVIIAYQQHHVGANYQNCRPLRPKRNILGAVMEYMYNKCIFSIRRRWQRFRWCLLVDVRCDFGINDSDRKSRHRGVTLHIYQK